MLLASETIRPQPPSPDSVDSLAKICDLLDRLLAILKEFPPIAKLIEAAYWRGFADGAMTAGAVAVGLLVVWYLFLRKG
jgi:hypothetical protein